MDRRSLLLRVLTAVVGIPLLLGAAWLGGWWWVAVVVALTVVAALEYLRLYPELRQSSRAGLFAGIAALLLLRWILGLFEGNASVRFLAFPFTVAGLTLVLYIFVIVPVVISADPSRTFVPRRPGAAAAWGWIYLGVPAAVLLRFGLDFDFTLVVWFFVVIWANDIAAYFGGSLLGRHKLSPILSPGKTWEGAAAGLGAGVVASWALTSWLDVTPLQAAVTGALIAIAAQLGDLFESALKRRVGVKDSGVVFPGHGGVLDRFDGALAAAPVAFLLLINWWAS